MLRGRLAAWRPTLGTDALVALVCAGFVLAYNAPFWHALLEGRDMAAASTWALLAAGAVIIGALHFALIAPFANRWTVRPLLAALIVIAALAGYYTQRWSVYLDANMLRNVLHTDQREARELIGWPLMLHLLLYAVLPIALLWRVEIRRQRGWLRALAWRAGAWLAALLLGATALLAQFQDLSATMRNHREMRFLITPGNVLWSAGVVLVEDTRAAARPRVPIATDATRAAPPAGARPMLVLMIVGETARAANWQLGGYARATTPELAALPELIAFTHVTSCGTNTEVSLPCMFSAQGRRHYDEDRIRGSDSVLQVLQRVGVKVFWRDNQSGCKGVCDGLAFESVAQAARPGLCANGRCFDEILLDGLDQALPAGRDRLAVLHLLGNHGPAYFLRYPPAYRRFVPACETEDLRLCSREQIVNAYDNALLYTDHVLARSVAWLRERSAGMDTALIYVSDHGESLGEGGLYLHGLPYAIAPDTQTRVPMVAWLSPGMAERLKLDLACVRQRAAEPASHDNLFHTLLGLYDVRSATRDAALDLLAACREPAAR